MILPTVVSVLGIRWLRQQVGVVEAVHQGRGFHVARFVLGGQGQKRRVIVFRRDPIPAGTLCSIMKQSGLPREEFIDRLSR